MRVCVAFRQDFRRDGPVACYARSVAEALENKCHEVVMVGEGHPERFGFLEDVDQTEFDALIEVENGRNSKGKLFFQQGRYKWKIPSCIWLIDSHGQPEIHQAVSKDYDHVFFAVWDKRDLYANHPSAHWCPNATDLKWFNGRDYPYEYKYDFGFIGSSHGLPRAVEVERLCMQYRWSCDIRQVSKPRKHKWPMCAEAMAKCRVLFNHGQKHDGPNQRVMESMAMCRPLLTDLDSRDGTGACFTEGKHFIGYESYTYDGLERKMKWVMDHSKKASVIAESAYHEVVTKHLVSNRVDQMLKVLNAY